jgi:serine/threonine protein kinase
MVGKTLSHYKILDKIGEGGMGVVYKAEDIRLHRTVALKFLPQGLESHEPERARFLQEAQAISALNHHNVCIVYDIGFEGEQQFIVMEYIEGKTLREIVPVRKMQEAIAFAIQIAEALHEAHTHGIVHRDIKAENIMVNSKNQIKVMDFGLAKLKGSLKLTKTSSTVGTLAYMAPEQIQGGEVDARSDIFSFGIVLYEMLTGYLPFCGEHDAAIMYSIVNDEPAPLQHYIPDSPSELMHILDRALEKDPEERYQTVNDMLIDLRRLKKETSKVVRNPSPFLNTPEVPADSGIGKNARDGTMNQIWRSKGAAVVYCVVLFAVVSIILFQVFSKKSHKALPFTRTQLTFSGNLRFAEISPDGKSFAYTDEAGSAFVQDIGGGKPLELLKGSQFADIRWAPNGTELAIRRIDTSSGVVIIPRFGGAVRRVNLAPFEIAWSPDCSSIAAIRQTWRTWNRILFVNILSGEIVSKVALNDRLYWNNGIDWSQSGNLLTIQTFDSLRTQRRILISSPDGHQQDIAFEDSSSRNDLPPPRWSPSGDAIYFVRGELANQSLMKVLVDLRDGVHRGSPREIEAGLAIRDFSISRDNRRMVGTWGHKQANLWSAAWNPNDAHRNITGEQITEGTSDIENMAISPDGNRIAYARGGQSGRDLVVAPFVGGRPVQISFGENVSEGGIAWSPDGKEIAYISAQSGVHTVRVISAEGGPSRIMGRGPLTSEAGVIWAPGSRILYALSGNQNWCLLDPQNGSESRLVTNDSLGWIISACYSPDGTTIAVNWIRKGETGVWTISTRDGSQKCIHDGLQDPLFWSADGETLYVRDSYEPNLIETISIADRKFGRFLSVPGKNACVVDMNATSHKIVWTVVESQSDAWLIENFDPEVE